MVCRRSRFRATSRRDVEWGPNFRWQRKYRARLVSGQPETEDVRAPRNSNASSGVSRGSQEFPWCATRTGEARNQIRISRSRNLALDLFPRSRRPRARDYDLRIEVASAPSLLSFGAKSRIERPGAAR